MCRHYHLVGLREEDVPLDDTHVGRLPQFPPAPLSQLPNSLGHLPKELPAPATPITDLDSDHGTYLARYIERTRTQPSPLSTIHTATT